MTLGSITQTARRQVRLHRAITSYTIAWIVVAVPVTWALIRLMDWEGSEYREPFSWSWEVIRRALATGTFWRQPAQAIFQAPYVTLADDPWQTGLLILLAVGVAYAAAWLLYSPPLLVALWRQRPKEPGPVATPKLGTSLARALFPALATDPGTGVRLAGGRRDLVVHHLGTDVVVETRVPKVPSFFVDSRTNRVERRTEFRLILPTASEVVLDGTTRDTSRIHLGRPWEDSAAVLFPPSVAALIVKELPNAELTGDGDTVTAIIPAKDVDDVRSLELLLESVARFADALERQAGRTRALPGRAGRAGHLVAKVERGQLRWRWWTRTTGLSATPVLVLLWTALATALIWTFGGGGSTGDLVAVLVVSVGVFAATLGRRLRASFVLRERPAADGGAPTGSYGKG